MRNRLLLVGSVMVLGALQCVGDSSPLPDGGMDATSDVASDAAPDVDAGPCPGQTQCGTACVTLSSDPNHCGSCNKKCPSTPDGGVYACTSGQCGDAIIDVAMGPYDTCAALLDGEVWCWGDNKQGELGMTPSSTGSAQPVKIPIDSVVHVAAGLNWVCAQKSDLTVWCWGENLFGSLGHTTGGGSPPDQTCGSQSCNPTPQKVGGLPNADQIFMQEFAACARATTGDIWCWGEEGACGNFGDPNQAAMANVIPTAVTGVHGVAQVQNSSTEGLTQCAIGDAGGVVCWGANTEGQAGHTPESTPPTCFFGAGSISPPTAVAGLSSATSVSPSVGSFTCATQLGGSAFCWGSNQNGTVIPGTTSTGPGNPTPQMLALGTSAHAVKIVSGELSACVLLDDGTVRCWGFDGEGQIGNGVAETDASVPVTQVMLTNAVNLYGGSVRFGALLKDGTLVMWGDNTNGELGHPSGSGSDVVCANGVNCGPAPSVVSGLP